MALRRPSPAIVATELARAKDVDPMHLAEALWKAERHTPGCLKSIIADTPLGRRKAYYMLKIWDRIGPLKLSSVTASRLGWTKLATIVQYAQPGTEREAVNLARRHTVKELETLLRMQGRVRPEASTVLLRLSPSQYQSFASVLLRFGATRAANGKGLASKEKALMKALRTVN